MADKSRTQSTKPAAKAAKAAPAAPASPAKEPKVWRPSPAMRTAAVVFGAAMAAFSAWVVSVAADNGWWVFGLAFVLLFFILPAVAGVLWAFRSVIELRAKHLRVVTTFAEHRFAWDEVRGAEPGFAGITIKLRNGGTFLAGAIQKDNLAKRLGRHTRADRLCDLITARATTGALE